MNKIRMEDILDLAAYEKARPEFRRRVVAMKKNRRLGIGDKMTLVFENRETVLFQIQEMVRVERLVQENAIRHEVETYNILIPGPNELSATMLIEIQELATIKSVLNSLVGLNDNRVSIEFGGERIFPLFDEGQVEEGRISAVQYIRFPFSGAQADLFRNQDIPALLRVDHPNYRHVSSIGPAIRAELIADLRP